MEIRYNVTGNERKRLVMTIAKTLNCKPNYKGAPSFDYEIDGFTVNREGTLIFDDRTDAESVEAVLEAAAREGFECGSEDEYYQVASPTRIRIEIPYDYVKVDILLSLLEAKGNLIQKALGASTTQIALEDDRVVFDWFDRTLTRDEADSYMLFITALCRLTKSLTRVNGSEKPIENEKYAFRCFLLRLGFIGAEYKPARKVLLSRLSGSSAFKGVSE